jgi:hypothetical protein
MKNFTKIVGITAMIAVIGLLTGCPLTGGEQGGTKDPLTGSVIITGAARVGNELTADTSALGGDGTISYQWKRADTAVAAGTDIVGSTGATYTPVQDDYNKYLKVTVTREGYDGSVTSSAVGAVGAAVEIIEGSFTATAHEEGISLKVIIAEIPTGTTNVQFRVGNSAMVNITSNEWQNWGEIFYEKDSIEIIYPFVTSGKTYTIDVVYEGSGKMEQTEITPTAGLGDLTVANKENFSLSYNASVNALSLSGTPQAPAFTDSNITQKVWAWTFVTGHNWNDGIWRFVVNTETIPTSFPLNPSLLSYSRYFNDNNYYNEFPYDAEVFVNLGYQVTYRDIVFQVDIADSASFKFLWFNDYEELEGTWLPFSGDPTFDTIVFTDTDATFTWQDEEISRSITVAVFIISPVINGNSDAAEYPSGLSFEGYIREGEEGIPNMEVDDTFGETGYNTPLYLNLAKDKFTGFGGEWAKEE